MQAKSKKRIRTWDIIVVFFLLLVMPESFRNLDEWKSIANNFVKNSYKIDYKLVSIEENGSEVYFNYVTEDEYAIEFRVTIYKGRESSIDRSITIPWDFSIGDNFKRKIKDYVWNEDKVIDITNMSKRQVEETLFSIIDNLRILEIKYNTDNLGLYFTVRYKDRLETILVITRENHAIDQSLRDVQFGW